MADAGAAGDLPQDAKAIIEILRSMGVENYEPRVVNQLLEFMYRKCSVDLEQTVASADNKLVCYTRESNIIGGEVMLSDYQLQTLQAAGNWWQLSILGSFFIGQGSPGSNSAGVRIICCTICAVTRLHNL